MGSSVRACDWQWTPADSTPTTVPLSFSISSGERVLLKGKSGAGKSTLLAAIAGCLDESLGNTRGEIVVDGVHPHTRRGEVGLVLQDPYAQTIMERVGDDIAFGLENIGLPRPEMATRITDALTAVGLPPDINRLTATLSGGQRQRLAIAGILAMRPQLLLLDEPTANLDPVGAQKVRDCVARIVDESNMTLIVVDHNPDLWRDVVTRTVVLDERGVVDVAHQSPSVVPPSRDVVRRASASDVLVRARDLSVGYPGGDIAARHVDFELIAGRILAVTGPNGCGKSALALTVGGLIPSVTGSLAFSPHVDPPSGAVHRWRPRDLARRIGSVFQSPEHQFVAGTVEADIRVGASSREVVETALSEYQLEHVRHLSPFALSGGEKRRLSIADIVVGHPRVLVFDEPTTGQDEETWQRLVDSFRALANAGHALLVVTHDQRFVDAIADDHLELGHHQLGHVAVAS